MSDMDRFVDEGSEDKPETPPPKKTPAKTPAKPPEKLLKQEQTSPIEEEEEEGKRLEDPADKGNLKDKEGEEGKIPPKGQKVKPWDLLDKFKSRVVALEKENAELKAKSNGSEVPKEALDKINTLETRNKELEDEIRFTKFEKSKEYQDNYHKPYLEAWHKAVAELQELTITEADGRTRAGNAKDLLMLAQLPLGKARQLANQWFGDAADDMMAHRRVLRELSDRQEKALEDARANGGEREKQAALELKAKEEAAAKNLAKAWDTINGEATAKYEFLRPVDGQPERNTALEKAIKFVDDSFAMSVNSAKTEQERDDVIRRHSALRNRAIGFSVLKHENKSLRAENEELKKKVSEYEASEPTSGEQGHDSRKMMTDPMTHALQGLADLAE